MSDYRAADAIAFHDQAAREFDQRYEHDPRFRSRYAAWCDLIGRYSGSGRAVLDVGCGSGNLSQHAAGLNASVVGIDGSAAMVERASARSAAAGLANTRFLVGRVEELAERVPGPYDLVLCSSVLEYLDDFEQALTVLIGRVRPGGVLLVSLPNGASLYRRLEPLLYRLTGRPVVFPYVRTVLPLPALAARCATAGAELLESRYYGAVPLWSPLCRAVGRPQWAETLYAAAFRRR
jgi:2-polyprenyl-6-hydroxyphenyl methylase/3-demethylubiquinone-9 3-methyltransferase